MIEDLTSAEIGLMQIVVDGFTDGEIAHLMGIPVQQVRTAIENLLAKLGLHHRVELILMAYSALNKVQEKAAFVNRA
jgi:DNA-binding NarL/FixJ family response regulator